jgi:hypothetical protein
LLLVKQGDEDKIEELVIKTENLMQQIKDSGIFSIECFKQQREKLTKLYEQLCLILAARKAKIQEDINKTRKFKKTIGAYKKSV